MGSGKLRVLSSNRSPQIDALRPSTPDNSGVNRGNACTDLDGLKAISSSGKSPGPLRRFWNSAVSPNPSRASSSLDPHMSKREYQMQEKIETLKKELCDIKIRENEILQMNSKYDSLVERLEQEHAQAQEKAQLERAAKDEQTLRCLQIENDRDQVIEGLLKKNEKIELQRAVVQKKHEALIERLQNDSLKKMESTKWLPIDEGKVTSQLARIKRLMRAWAKDFSIKNMSIIRGLHPDQSILLMSALSNVVILVDGKLPIQLSSPKSPALLLNALLAHDVYMNVFRNPYFFLSDGLGDSLSREGVDKVLYELYLLTQDSDHEETEIFRSQLLRLLLPPLRSESNDHQQQLHTSTEKRIVKVSERHASNFIKGVARHLIANDTRGDHLQRVQAIYQEAALLSYKLWTRKTAMRCTTLKEMDSPTFDIKSTTIEPHTLVRYYEHDDELFGRPITLMVHPLLEAYGTDDAEHYDKSRVWVAAEVWLDSSKNEG